MKRASTQDTNFLSSGLKQLFTFSGRASLSEFWLFFFAVVVLALLFILAHGRFFELKAAHFMMILCTFPLLLIPLAVRRLHDRGKSGWQILLFFWPFPIMAWINLGAAHAIIDPQGDFLFLVFMMGFHGMMFLAYIPFFIYACVVLGKRGDLTANRYGQPR